MASSTTHSSGNSECVEFAFLDGGVVGVRDSKNPTGPALVFAPRRVGCLHRRAHRRHIPLLADLKRHRPGTGGGPFSGFAATSSRSMVFHTLAGAGAVQSAT
ncbi:DUF397 domain-containing protein [Nocardia sp. IFM 10818]